MHGTLRVNIHLNRGSSLNHGTNILAYYNSWLIWFITCNHIFCKQEFDSLCSASTFVQDLKGDPDWFK